MIARIVAALVLLAMLVLAGCWYTTMPQDSNPDCRKQTYGFLLFSTSSSSCPSETPTPAAISTPVLIPRAGG